MKLRHFWLGLAAGGLALLILPAAGVAAPNIPLLAAGSGHTLGIQRDASLLAWGYNFLGQLGLGDYTERHSPARLTRGPIWVGVTAGQYHSLGLKVDGTLWAWGNNGNGELGLGNYNSQTTPQRVGTATNWVAVAAGQVYSLGLKADGTLWAWGYNAYGQLGNGDTSQQNSPVQVTTPAGNTWQAVATGYSHSLGIREGGGIYAWGYNSNGQLGLGSADTSPHSTPTRITTGGPGGVGGFTWVAVAAGNTHSLGLYIDGTLWAWGSDSYGQLGINSTTDVHYPIQITDVPGGDYNWVAVAAGYQHSLALKADGTLWAWGYNGNGQLGLGTSSSSYYTTPQLVGSGYVAIASGNQANHSLALKADGTLWAWGLNDIGQLGLGDTTNRLSPTKVHNFNFHSLAVIPLN